MIKLKYKGKETEKVLNIENEMANEIKKDENKIVDIYQSDIDIEFNIMQNLVFQKCGGLEMDGETGIVEK